MCLWYKSNVYIKGIKLLWYKSSSNFHLLFAYLFHPTVYKQVLVKTLSNILKYYSSGIDPYIESLCIEVLHHHHRAEAIIVVGIAIRNVRVKHSSIATIIAIATAYHERIVSVQFNP